MHILVNLKRYSPIRIFFDIIYYFRNNDIKSAPFRLQKQSAIDIHLIKKLFSPFKVISILYDYFEFISDFTDFINGWHVFFGGEAYPIPVAA